MTPEVFVDRQARNAAPTNLRENAFIEAGAGTGKSTILVQRIVNTITGPGNVPVTQIAAITFTERAGAELRHRLREAIVKRLAEFEAASDVHGALTDALHSLDAAPIGTIHAFAQRLLRTHALSAKLPLGFVVPSGAEAADDDRLRVRSAVEHLDAQLDDETRGILAAYDLAPFDLITLLGELDKQWLRLDDAAFAWSGVDIQAWCSATADEFEAFLRTARDDCAVPDDRLMIALEDCIPPVVEILRRVDLGELAGLAPGVSGLFKIGGVGTKAAWGPDGAKARRDAFKELEPQLHECVLAPLEIAVRQCLSDAWTCMREHREQRARNGLVPFDELLSRARDLVRDDAEVRRQVHAAFAVVMVDEFQDTDPVQWELIRRITADPDDPAGVPLPGRLVVVGDPKQAIYSFRGADVDTYRAALDGFKVEPPQGTVYELTTNFRSVGPLIARINEIFAAAMSADPLQVEYRDLAVRNRPDSTNAGPAVVVVRDPDPAEVKSTDLEPRLLAQEIVRAVRDGWLITRPGGEGPRVYDTSAGYSDIAILYPTRTGVPALLEALDDAGVPYRSGDAGLVFDRPVALGLLAAIAVIDDPSRELDLWLALKSPLFGCTDVDLLEFSVAGGRWRLAAESTNRDGMAITGPVAEALSVLHGVRFGLDALQPVAVIDALLERTRIMEALALAPSSAFDADCVRMLRAHAQQFQDEGGVGLADYLFAVEDLNGDSTRGSLPEPAIRDDNAVRLMTVHQAKGLEFPIVVLAGMANAIYDPAPDIGVVRRDRYEFRLTGGRASLGYVDWDERDRLPRSRAERVRLLYVACTRARDHLIVSLCGANRGSGNPYASLLWEAMPADPSDVTALEDPPVVAEAQGPDPVEPLPSGWADEVTRIRAVSAVPFVASPSGRGAEVFGGGSASAHQEPGTQETGPDEARPADAETASEAIDATVGEKVRAARDGRPLGRAVHAALDRLVRLGGLPQPEDVESACRDAAADEDVADDVVLVRVRAGLASELMVEALTASRRWAELYLAAPVDDGAVRVVEGFADLVFERGDGCVVVDYKTDETISAEARQHYADQLATYAELVKRATGRAVADTVILHVGEKQAEEIRL